MPSVFPGRERGLKSPTSQNTSGHEIADSATNGTRAEVLDRAMGHAVGARPFVPVIQPRLYRDTPLDEEYRTLCDPAAPLTDLDLTLLAAKYFYAFVIPDGHRAPVPLEDLSGLFERFSRHGSLNEPGDDVDTMNRLRRWSFALRLPADIPKTAHILRAVIRHPSSPEGFGKAFTGLDVGAGTGILMLGQAIQAKRNGFESVVIHGLEYDPAVAERADEIIRDFGVGEVHQADARLHEAYAPVKNVKLAFVTNEAVAGMHPCMEQDRFSRINRALFRALGPGLSDAEFFPEGVIAYARDHDVSVMLTRGNEFMGPSAYRGRPLTPLGLLIENEIVPMHKLGADFMVHVPRPARKWLQRRW